MRSPAGRLAEDDVCTARCCVPIKGCIAARRGRRLRTFPRRKGPGVHHVAVATLNFDETVAQADRGNGVVLSGEFGGARVAYLGTDRDLGMIIEIFSGTPDNRSQPDETSP